MTCYPFIGYHDDGCTCRGRTVTHDYGEHPPFSPEELAEIRRMTLLERIVAHRDRDETAVPSHRDKLTMRLLTLERIEEKTR